MSWNYKCSQLELNCAQGERTSGDRNRRKKPDGNGREAAWKMIKNQNNNDYSREVKHTKRKSRTRTPLKQWRNVTLTFAHEERTQYVMIRNNVTPFYTRQPGLHASLIFFQLFSAAPQKVCEKPPGLTCITANAEPNQSVGERMRHGWNPLITNDKRHSHLRDALGGWSTNAIRVCAKGEKLLSRFRHNHVALSPSQYMCAMCVSTQNKVQIISAGCEKGCLALCCVIRFVIWTIIVASTRKVNLPTNVRNIGRTQKIEILSDALVVFS